MNSSRQHLMELPRFEAILDAYGGNPERWPLEEKQQALTLLAQSPMAKSLQQSANSLDLLLDASKVPEPSPELMASILMQTPPLPAPSTSKSWFSWPPIEPFWKPAAVLAFSVFLGIVVGFQLPPPTGEVIHTASLESHMEQWISGPEIQIGMF
jgi:hypothetical protein